MAVILVALLLTTHGYAAPAPAPAKARLCVTRPEQGGYLNIVPVRVGIGRAGRPLGGGESSCLEAPPGVRAVALTWRWDERDPSPVSYRGAPIRMRLNAGETRRLWICPGAAGPNGEPRWRLAAHACPTQR